MPDDEVTLAYAGLVNYVKPAADYYCDPEES